jgi:hypothetical protein
MGIGALSRGSIGLILVLITHPHQMLRLGMSIDVQLLPLCACVLLYFEVICIVGEISHIPVKDQNTAVRILRFQSKLLPCFPQSLNTIICAASSNTRSN